MFRSLCRILRPICGDAGKSNLLASRGLSDTASVTAGRKRGKANVGAARWASVRSSSSELPQRPSEMRATFPRQPRVPTSKEPKFADVPSEGQLPRIELGVSPSASKTCCCHLQRINLIDSFAALLVRVFSTYQSKSNPIYAHRDPVRVSASRFRHSASGVPACDGNSSFNSNISLESRAAAIASEPTQGSLLCISPVEEQLHSHPCCCPKLRHGAWCNAGWSYPIRRVN